jgi:AcrR family transcriptional regulator
MSILSEMSDSENAVALAKAPGKRDRLVQAAAELIHQQGVERTTLAEIAAEADVPLGNVYYYFKTKDALLDAVVESHLQNIDATIATLARHRTPKGRLKGLTRLLAGRCNEIAQYGCPHGTLCSEMEKTGDDHAAGRLFAAPLAWLEQQFRLMGRDDAQELAIEFLVSYQGAAVLTHALRDPSLLADEGKRLERWIDSLDAQSERASSSGRT